MEWNDKNRTDTMTIVRKEIDISKKPTRRQIEMLKAASKTPLVYDEDNPPLTKEELSQFKRVSDLIK